MSFVDFSDTWDIVAGEIVRRDNIEELTKNLQKKIWFTGPEIDEERFNQELRLLVRDLKTVAEERIGDAISTPDYVGADIQFSSTISRRVSQIIDDIGKADSYEQLEEELLRLDQKDILKKDIKSMYIFEILKEEKYYTPIRRIIKHLGNVVEEVWKRAKKTAYSAGQIIKEYISYLRAPSLGIAGMVGFSIGRTIFGKKYSFPCMFGGVPIEHVEELEIAHSGKVLKFRAQGSVFLAHQVGGKDAMRVSGIMLKDEALLKIPILWALYLYNRGKMIKDFEDIDIGNYRNLDELFEIRDKFDTSFSYDKEVEKPSYRHYKTLPFVTRHGIIPNAFIETFSFEDKTVNGLDVINYDLLLRTYEPPEELKIYEYEVDGKTESSVGFVAPAHDYKSKFNMVSTFVLNGIWRFLQQNELWYDHRSWKKQVECRYVTEREPLSISDYAKLRKGQLSPQEIETNKLVEKKDVYYDIDAGDIAYTFAMGAMGFGAMKSYV